LGTLALTNLEARHCVCQIAAVLRQRFPVVQGNRVLLRSGNCIDLTLACLGMVHASGVAVASMPPIRAREIGEVITKASLRPAMPGHVTC
jgi:2-aminobenzoate-CoA ligase